MIIKKTKEFFGRLNFLNKYVCEMKLCLRTFYNNLRQQNTFEWTLEHQKRSDEIKTLLTGQISNTIHDPNHHSML